jgi:hypothetical protein
MLATGMELAAAAVVLEDGMLAVVVGAAFGSVLAPE